MYQKVFLYFRLVAKCVTFPFAIAGVTLFIIQFLPTYIGKDVGFWVFVAGSIFWALETLWATCDGVQQTLSQIKEHR